MGEPIKGSYIIEKEEFIDCPFCDGSGIEEVDELICRKCKGTGEVENV